MDNAYESHIGLADEQLSIIFKSDAVSPDSRNNRIHWHEGVELLFITSGSGYMLCDSQKIALKCCNIAIISSNCLHKAASDTEQMTYEYLILEPPLFELLGLTPQSLVFESVVPAPDELWDILDRLTALKNSPQPFGWMVQKGLLLQLIGHMMMHCLKNISGGSLQRHRKNEPVRKALDYIRRHYTENISLDILCEHTGFSKYYFCRLFKEMTGQTVNSYINSFRCHEVQKLLKYASVTVEEAALRCGFSNISHFYRMYKQHIGHIPSVDKSNDRH